MDEYIIINKSILEKRIKELEKQRDEYIFNPNRTDDQYRYNSMIKVLKEVLSQSIPLIPEIEKHSIEFTKTLLNCTISEAKSIDNIKEYHPKEYQLLLGELELNGKELFEDYISNLKLDI